MKKQMYMKTIINKHTMELEEKALELQTKKTYLDCQRALLTCLYRETDTEKRNKIKALIKETGEIYEKWKQIK